MSKPATSVIHMASAAAAAMLLVAGLAFQIGNAPGQTTAPAVPDVQLLAVPDAQDTGSVPDAAFRAADIVAEAVTVRPMLAIIIDDIGPDPQTAQTIIDSGLPVTLSILPSARAAPQIAQAATQAGLEIFVHVPMEPVGLDDPGPNAILRSHDAGEMSRRVTWALSRVPGAAGFNNHMGSAMTADAPAMSRLFSSFDRTDLIFVDSLTHPRSVAAGTALASGVTAIRRDVFLDHVRTPEAIARAIDEALRRAVETGSALAIGHPHPATLEQLRTLSQLAEARGVQLVTVRQLAEARASRQAS